MVGGMETTQRAIIIGVTGAIGRGLPPMLAQHGIATTGVSRSKGVEIEGVDAWQTPDQLDLTGHSIVINLAGESVAQRWTEANKSKFRQSRVGVTRHLVEAIAAMPEGGRPRVLVNGSAVGIYGDRGDEVLTEGSAVGEGYLADLCCDWEAAAREAEALGVRVVCLRTGVVLGRGADAFEKLVGVLRTGLGGKLGNGRQWMPWIHIRDIRGAIVHAVRSEDLSGPVNGAAPGAERNADLTRKLAKALHRPAILPVPGFALKLAVGGFASALLGSQRARPEALQTDGYQFHYRTLEEALEELVG